MTNYLRHLINILIIFVFSLVLGFSSVFCSSGFYNLSEDDNQINAFPFTVEGILSYVDRNGATSFGRNYLCRVMDYDNSSSDDLLWKGETGRFGEYA